MPHWSDNQINEKIRELRFKRAQINTLAEKYGLSDVPDTEVAQLSLISMPYSQVSGADAHHSPQRQQDRIKEYQKITQERQKRISLKNQEKRKLKAELEQ